MSTSTLLTVPEVAARLRMSKKFVLNELRRGNLVGSRFGRAWHIDEVALQTYIDAHLNVRPIRRRSKTA